MYNPLTTVNIALQTSGITAAGFGTPLFIADIDTSVTSDPLGAGVRVKTYSSLEEVANDFDTSDAAYKAAQAFLRPTPSVQSFKIGYRDTATGTAETATEAYAACKAYDNDLYFLTAESHASTDVIEYADAVEADTKFYFTSSEETTALTQFQEGVSTDTLAALKEGNYSRSKGFFHHEADTAFPECTLVGYNAPFPAGSVVWEVLQLPLSASQDPTTGNLLSTTQKGYLEDRNATYTERLGANTVINRNGKTAGGGEYIDDVRGRDSLEEDLNVALQGLLARQKGSKLPYNNAGITQIYDAVDNVLSRYSQNPRNFINPNYKMTFPMANDVPLADKEARVYQAGRFEAELTGGITRVVINGSLKIQL